MKKRLVGCGLIAGMLALAPGLAGAATITYQLGPNDFSGSGTNASAPIFVTLADVAGGVQMSVSASLLPAGEKVAELYLNFDPNLAIGSLSAAYTSGVSATSLTISTDCCKADGDGLYDILFGYPTNAGSYLGGSGGAGSTSVYLFSYSGAGTFNISSFNFLSTPDGGHGPFIMAAHIQGIGGGSAWVANQTTTTTTTTGLPTTTDQPTTTTGVPEPASLLVLGMGLVVAGRRLRRKVS